MIITRPSLSLILLTALFIINASKVFAQEEKADKKEADKPKKETTIPPKPDEIRKAIEDGIKNRLENKEVIEQLAKAITKAQNEAKTAPVELENKELKAAIAVLKTDSTTLKNELLRSERERANFQTQVQTVNNENQRLLNEVESMKANQEKQHQLLASTILTKNVQADPNLIDALLEGLPKTDPLVPQLQRFKSQSLILTAASDFLDQGQGDYNVIYPNLKQPINATDFPAQYQHQQKILKRFENFNEAAIELNKTIQSIVAVPSRESRSFKLNNFEYGYVMPVYPFLNKIYEANYSKHTPLGIDLNNK